MALVLLLALFLFLIKGIASYEKKVELKIQPYHIEISLFVNENMTTSIDYDYGFGFNPSHRRLFLLSAKEKKQTLTFSLSAWKKILALRFNAWQNNQSQVFSVVITQADRTYKLNQTQLVQLNKGHQLTLLGLDTYLKQHND